MEFQIGFDYRLLFVLLINYNCISWALCFFGNDRFALIKEASFPRRCLLIKRNPIRYISPQRLMNRMPTFHPISIYFEISCKCK